MPTPDTTSTPTTLTLDEVAFPATLEPDSIAATLATELAVKRTQVTHTLELLDAGNTVPLRCRSLPAIARR